MEEGLAIEDFRRIPVMAERKFLRRMRRGPRRPYYRPHRDGKGFSVRVQKKVVMHVTCILHRTPRPAPRPQITKRQRKSDSFALVHDPALPDIPVPALHWQPIVGKGFRV